MCLAIHIGRFFDQSKSGKVPALLACFDIWSYFIRIYENLVVTGSSRRIYLILTTEN